MCKRELCDRLSLMNYKINEKKNLPRSLVEYEIEVAWEELAKNEEKVVKHLGEHAEIKGFRKGSVPEKMLRDRVGDMVIIEEMADETLQELYPILVNTEKIEAIGRPQVVITKIARGNPLAVRITIPVIPKFDLPDYKKIASNVKLDEVNVTDEDLEKLIHDIRKNYARHTHSYKSDHDHEAGHRDEDLVIPDLTDELVKKFGEFNDVAEFRNKMRENLKLDKEARARDKRRAEIAEKILGETTIDVPEILVESEQDKMMGQMEGDIARAGLKIEDYLKHLKKTREELRASFTTDAEKRAKLQVIISEIAAKEKIKPEEEQVKKHYDEILLAQPEANPINVKLYVEQVLTNEAVFDFLEVQK